MVQKFLKHQCTSWTQLSKRKFLVSFMFTVSIFNLMSATATVALCQQIRERHRDDAVENVREVTSFGLSRKILHKEIHSPAHELSTGLYRQPRVYAQFHGSLLENVYLLWNTHATHFPHTAHCCSTSIQPLSEKSVLVPVPLSPPPLPLQNAHSTLIGQLSQAWTRTAHHVPQWWLCRCGITHTHRSPQSLFKCTVEWAFWCLDIAQKTYFIIKIWLKSNFLPYGTFESCIHVCCNQVCIIQQNYAVNPGLYY